MNKIVTIANPVGGTAKTTTAHAIAVAAAEYGRKVLLIDADPKASLTSNLGVENPRATLLEVGKKQISLELAVVRTAERFDFLAGTARTLNFASSLDSASFSNYELVVIDTPSNFSNAYSELLKIADLVIAPCDGSINSARGVQLLSDFVPDNSKVKLLKLNWNQSEAATLYQKLLSEHYLELDTQISSANPQDFAIGALKHQHAITVEKGSKLGSEYRELTYFLLAQLFRSESDLAL